MEEAVLSREANPPIFPNIEEVCQLGTPIVVGLVVALELGGVLRVYADRSLLSCFNAIFLLATTHNAFTFSALLTSPEFRAAADAAFDARARLRFLLEFAFWMSLFFVAAAYKGGPLFEGIAALALTLRMLTVVTHSVWQVYGIGRLYEDHPRNDRRQAWEKRLFHLLILTICVPTAIYALYESKVIDPPWLNRGVLFRACACLVAVPATLILANTYRASKSCSRKFLFQLRLLLQPFAITSFLIMLLVSAQHGVEYLLVQKKSRTSPRFEIDRERQLSLSACSRRSR